MRPHKMCKQCFNQISPYSKNKNSDLDFGESGYILDDVVCAAVSNKSSKHKAIALQHHIFTNGSGWQQRQSLPQPGVTVTAHISKEDYE